MNQVGLVFEIRSVRKGPEFFPSLTEATTRIREILLNPVVNTLWVGTQLAHESALNQLLQELNQERGFVAFSEANSLAKVYGLELT